MEKYSQFRDRGKYIVPEVKRHEQGSQLMHALRVWHCSVLSRYLTICGHLVPHIYLPVRPKAAHLLHRVHNIFLLPTMATSWVTGEESHVMVDTWYTRNLVDRPTD